MLYHIVDPKIIDKDFEKFVGYIKAAYWPEEKYKEKAYKLPTWPISPPENRIIDEIRQRLHELVKEICLNGPGLYTKTNGAKGTTTKDNCMMELPFMDRFHELFLQRQYDYPYRDPPKNANNILTLRFNSDKGNENYSKNFGNFNHFVNVAMATARIIMYFGDQKRISLILKTDRKDPAAAKNVLPATLSYQGTPNARTFKLMLASFYHDIGKTIVNHRHGMEGAFIIADHTTRSLAQLDTIIKKYSKKVSLEREDLLEISNLLSYHDSFGTFGTGESSYTLLTEIIDRIKRGGLKYLGETKLQKEYCNRTLFDLWVLNIADIIVSNKDKFKYQEHWVCKDKSFEAIERFFKSEGGRNRIHDLKVAQKLLEKHNEGTHSDDTLDLERMAQQESRAHTIERIKRLVWASLGVAIVQFVDTEKDGNTSKVKLDVLDYILKVKRDDGGAGSPKFKENLDEPEVILQQGIIHNVIFRSIQSLNDSNEFYKRLAWIVSMDYALGFFTKIARRAIEVVDRELQNETGAYITGWIRSRSAQTSCSNTLPEEPLGDYICNANAMFFVDNYCATVVKILAHLLFRERSIDQPSNIEFEDASNRLIDDKIDKIIGMEGPYRQNKTIELILKTVFVY
jgi:hypothetical protein